jgi:hypothetical protein
MTALAYRVLGWLLIVLALLAIGASIPVEGLAGAGLAVGGIWIGWYFIVRRGVTR